MTQGLMDPGPHSRAAHVKWWRGDWINYGEDRADWGEMYTQALDESDLAYNSLRKEAWVSRRIDLWRRRHN